MVMIADCGGDGDKAGCLLSLCHPKTGNVREYMYSFYINIVI